MIGAAGAMEKLRALAMEREESARQRRERGVAQAERLAHERALASIDEAAPADLRARESALRREMAHVEASERVAEASPLARALRRP
jgi:hypothetical protein